MIYLICSRCDLLTVAVSTVPKLPNDHVFTLARILDGYNDNAIRVSIRVLPFFLAERGSERRSSSSKEPKNYWYSI